MRSAITIIACYLYKAINSIYYRYINITFAITLPCSI